MREFKDDEGRPWRLALTVAAAIRVKGLVSVESDVEEPQDGGGTKTVRRLKPLDIVDIATIGETLSVLRSQPTTLGEILYAVLIAQVDEKKLTKEQFLDGLRGDALDAAANALEEELVDFFPQRLRPLVAGMAAKFAAVTTAVLAGAQQKLLAVDPDAVSGTLFGKPQESSESGQASGHTDNSPQPVTAA
jgi:hypothetical protein